MTLSPGDSVGSSYRVVRLLGEGGMGAVVAIAAGAWFSLRAPTAEDDATFYDHLYDIPSYLS